MSVVLELAGQRFNRLLVVERRGSRRGHSVWLCKCDCGREVEVSGNDLKQGKHKSCGCTRWKALRKHGGYGAPEYLVWRGIIGRCYNRQTNGYAHYGGRGISMCDKWRNDFQAFVADVGPRPTLTHQIDRIDSNGNYEPGNVRWVTPKANSNNKRDNTKYTLNGVEKTMSQWADDLGMQRSTLFSRLSSGWDPALALTTPVVLRPDVKEQDVPPDPAAVARRGLIRSAQQVSALGVDPVEALLAAGFGTQTANMPPTTEARLAFDESSGSAQRSTGVR